MGRIAVGRVERGTIKVNQEVTICDFHNSELKTKGKVVALYEYSGLGKKMDKLFLETTITTEKTNCFPLVFRYFYQFRKDKV